MREVQILNPKPGCTVLSILLSTANNPSVRAGCFRAESTFTVRLAREMKSEKKVKVGKREKESKQREEADLPEPVWCQGFGPPTTHEANASRPAAGLRLGTHLTAKQICYNNGLNSRS